MPIQNNIAAFAGYSTILDEVLTMAALTGVLESDPNDAKPGANVGELMIPMMDMDGLGDYDHQRGYPAGAVTLKMETVKCNYERGRMFTVDFVDDEEAAGMAYGKLAGEFIRTKVVPEIDAVRFAKYASLTKATGRAVSATFADGKALIKAISAAQTQMDNDEVPQEGRYLFLLPSLKRMLDDMDTYQSKKVLDGFAGVIVVPPSRFHTSVTLLTGADDDTNRAGGFKAAGSAINFLIVYKKTILQHTKHARAKVVTPEQNQDADAWKFGYRVYGLNDAYQNKLSGLYVNTQTAIEEAAAASEGDD